MPTYQYACTEAECGHAFEQVQAFTDDALTQCPTCEGRVRKVFNAVGVVFKGSGFYRTDSREATKRGSDSAGATGAASDSGASKSSQTAGASASSTQSEMAGSSGSSGSSGPGPKQSSGAGGSSGGSSGGATSSAGAA